MFSINDQKMLSLVVGHLILFCEGGKTDVAIIFGVYSFDWILNNSLVCRSNHMYLKETIFLFIY